MPLILSTANVVVYQIQLSETMGDLLRIFKRAEFETMYAEAKEHVIGNQCPSIFSLKKSLINQ